MITFYTYHEDVERVDRGFNLYGSGPNQRIHSIFLKGSGLAEILVEHTYARPAARNLLDDLNRLTDPTPSQTRILNALKAALS